MNTQNYIPSRNDILSLATESFESFNQINNSIFESEMYGGRNKPSPGDEFHQSAIEFLKTDLKLPEIEARAYKSIAYRKVKEMNPEANHLDRAKLMLEMVKSKNFVKENKDKLAEVVKILENLDAEKANKTNETENNTARRSSGLRKSSKKSSRKGSRKSQRGGNLSETSVDVNYTESKANIPYYNEYRAMKTQYLQAKNKQMGGGRILSFNSIESLQNFLKDNQNTKLSATIMLQ